MTAQRERLEEFRPVAPRDVIGNDDRERVGDTTVTPWRLICCLDIAWSDGTTERGTGWLVSPRTVITAAHCVHSGELAASVTVTPGLDASHAPFGSMLATELRVPDEWVASRQPAFDYGAIILDADATANATGCFEPASLDDATLTGTPANLCGYPIDLDDGMCQYYNSRRIASVDEKALHYDIDTFAGMSGGPIWLRLGDRRVVVGIHTTGSSIGNSAVRLHSRALSDITAWTR